MFSGSREIQSRIGEKAESFQQDKIRKACGQSRREEQGQSSGQNQGQALGRAADGIRGAPPWDGCPLALAPPARQP